MERDVFTSRHKHKLNSQTDARTHNYMVQHSILNRCRVQCSHFIIIRSHANCTTLYRLSTHVCVRFLLFSIEFGLNAERLTPSVRALWCEALKTQNMFLFLMSILIFCLHGKSQSRVCTIDLILNWKCLQKLHSIVLQKKIVQSILLRSAKI